MHRFFLESKNVLSENRAVLTDEAEIKHLVRVLRAGVGEMVELCVDQQRELIGKIDQIEDAAVYFQIVDEKIVDRESPIRVDLYQGLPKADKMEWIVQKTVELGVHSVIPVQMARSVSKITDEKDNQKKTQRWQKIADEAAKQSKRLAKVEVKNSIKFKGLEAIVQDYDLFLIPYELENSTGLKPLLEKMTGSVRKIGILIGPEGGIDESELQRLVENGAKAITLGPRILRTETAGMTTLVMLQYELGDLGGF